MRILFVCLVHDRAADVAETTRALVSSAEDAVALIHLDNRCSPNVKGDLSTHIGGEGAVWLVNEGVACGWGSFGLVEAVLNALNQAEANGDTYDYVILLSGACLPHKPIRQLERFLAENYGQEFIESGDESWILDGLRQERYLYRFWFNHKTHPRAERAFFKLQRALRLRRRFPGGLVPRFGSQWWALTWDTCRAILDYNRRHPQHLRFFREVWIPDEMYFPTLVHHLAPDRIAGYGLTHYKFSDKGKPLVYHDDHVDHLAQLPRFFFRKADPAARRLRERALAIAAEPDDGRPLDDVNAAYPWYERKVAAQTSHPRAGQAFYRDQWVDKPEGILGRVTSPYVLLVMPPRIAAQLAQHLSEDNFQVFGQVFHEQEVDLGADRSMFRGLSRGDRAIRDHDPALYLARLRRRCSRIPVIACFPPTSLPFWKHMAGDPFATVVSCLPGLAPWARQRLKAALARDAASHDSSQESLAVLEDIQVGQPDFGFLPSSGAGSVKTAQCRLLLSCAEARAQLPSGSRHVDIPWRALLSHESASSFTPERDLFAIGDEWHARLISELSEALKSLKVQGASLPSAAAPEADRSHQEIEVPG